MNDLKNVKNDTHHNPCSYFEQGVCRSCNLMGESVESGREKKLQEFLEKLNDSFPKIALEPFFGLADFRGSRQKAKLACFEKQETGSLQLGIYTLSEKLSLEDCPLYTQAMQKVISGTKHLLEKAQIKAYDIHKRSGEAKFVLITESLPYQGESHHTYMVRLVLRSKEGLDRLQKHSVSFLQEYPQVKLLSVNIQPEPKAILEGEEEIILNGAETFINGFQDQKLNLTVRSFSQINSFVAFHLYQYVKDLLSSKNVTSLLDLYCGVGGFSLSAREVLSEVWGVEISNDAVKMANKSAKEFGKENFYYEAGDVEKILYSKSKLEYPQAVIVNPPRAGLGTKTIEFINNSQIQHLIYSSCNPETFTRDALMLNEHYELISLAPFDMFMMTNHFEVVGYFQLK